MAIKWAATGGKRYYVIGIAGYRINPKTGMSTSGNRPASTTYAVCDRDWMHREMGVFEPVGRSTAWCKQAAEALAKELNKAEARGA